MALEVTLKQRPSDYVKQVVAMLPKQVSFEHSTVAQLEDGELDALIEQLRQRALEAREQQALPPPMKVINHAR